MTIALLLVALWIPSFITGNVDPALRSPVSPLYNFIADLLDFWPPFMLIIALLLMAFDVVFFNSILASNQVIGKVNTTGGVVFLLMMKLSICGKNLKLSLITATTSTTGMSEMLQVLSAKTGITRA